MRIRILVLAALLGLSGCGVKPTVPITPPLEKSLPNPPAVVTSPPSAPVPTVATPPVDVDSPTRRRLSERERDRFEVLMKSASNLEGRGNRRGALEFYRDAYREFYGTPEAKRAAERITALGGEVPSASEARAPKLADAFTPPKPPKKPHYASQAKAQMAVERAIGSMVQGYIARSNQPPPPPPSPLFGGGLVGGPVKDQFVNGYTRSNGTYVAPYMRSAPR